MKKSLTLAPRWATYGVPGVVAAFLIFITYSLVSAQTFTNPTCDPTSNVNCNIASPLFLTPTNTSTAQVLRSPLQIGVSETAKNLTLYGALDIGTTIADGTFSGARIRTAANITGQGINVTSSGDTAIVGNSGNSGSAGLYGLATNAGGYGVYALNTANTVASYSLFADGGTSGNAAKFRGNTQIISSDQARTATFSVDSTGNLNIQTSVAGKGITVNGTSVGAGGYKTRMLTSELTVGGVATYDKAQLFGTASNYRVVSVNAMYASKATPARLWYPIPIDVATPKIVYEECSGTGYLGQLRVTNPLAVTQGTSIRVYVTYEEVDVTSVCGGETTAPTIAWNPNPTAGVAGTVLTLSVNAADNTAVTKVEFFDNGVLVGTDTTAAATNPTHSMNVVRATGTHSYTARAYDASGNTTTTNAVVVVHTDACNNTCNYSTQFCCSTTATCMANGQICGGGGGAIEL